MHALLYVYVGIFGMILGSFLGLASIRIPLGESVLSPRSHCRGCGRTLSWYENVPIFSYIFLRFRCRICRATISPRYLVIELATTALTLLAFWKLTPWPRFLLYLLLFIAPLILLIAIDWERLILPDVLTLPGILAGFIVHWVDQRYLDPFRSSTESSLSILLESLLGAVAGSLTLWLLAWLYRLARNKVGMGGGDIKLAAMLGAVFGWKAIFFIFMFSSILGILLGIFWILKKGHSKDTPLPFGAFLGSTALLYLFWGDSLVKLYMKYTFKLG